MAVALLTLVVAAYAAVATAYLEARRRAEAPPRWARAAGPLSVAVHLGALVALSMEIHRSPFATSGQSLSFLAFSLTALYVVMEASSRVAAHGGAFYVAAAVVAAAGVPSLVGGATVEPARDVARTVHVGLALLGTAATLAGGLLAVGYLGAYRSVKRGILPTTVYGPSLSGFERLERRASVLGVFLLGPALALGVRAATTSGAPPGTTVLVGVTGVLFVLLASAGFLWWHRPRLGSLAAWLNLAGTVAAILAFAVVHPLVLRAGG